MSERKRRISDIIPAVQGQGIAGRNVALDADVRFLQPADTIGVAIDANATGMRVVVDNPIAVGSRCIAVVQLTDGDETHERARVVSSERSPRGWIVGLEFAS